MLLKTKFFHITEPKRDSRRVLFHNFSYFWIAKARDLFCKDFQTELTRFAPPCLHFHYDYGKTFT